ncbi:cysteine desulfurase family protein [Defluviitalea raffinosedens]|uniref:cysteine desulfurase family protein n=1 Tax=Defluviitalea raffinosedens TaxID=1450156 RepID=UPI001956E25D|nr:cysteine desulfurase family protein [Defluviitalea raffinosedens]MBM7685984.1 cysteine desulfurase [Defluviitalea raffinosedens]
MIYLDNSATSPVDPEVLDAMLPYLKEEYGNPASKYYTLAQNAKKAVEESREKIAALINANPEEIIFTAGASESNNMIIKGIVDYKRYYENMGNHIITSSVEHESVLNTCKFLNGEIYSSDDATFSFSDKKQIDRGYEITFLPVNEFGQVEAETLEKAIKSSTVLVSVIWGNNETGTLNDIDQIGSLCKKHNVLLHSDCTQLLGKYPVDVNKTPVDFLSFSAHKIYGPKGIGAAYVRGDEYGLPPFTSLIHGGNQEKGFRAGTLSVHNIVGFGKAAEIAKRDMDSYIEKISTLENLCRKRLKEALPNIEFVGHPDQKIPGIISIIIHDDFFNNERFIKKISDKVAISTGSACTSGNPSHVLTAMGKAQDTKNVLRISINKYTSENDLTELAALLANNI